MAGAEDLFEHGDVSRTTGPQSQTCLGVLLEHQSTVAGHEVDHVDQQGLGNGVAGPGDESVDHQTGYEEEVLEIVRIANEVVFARSGRAAPAGSGGQAGRAARLAARTGMRGGAGEGAARGPGGCPTRPSSAGHRLRRHPGAGERLHSDGAGDRPHAGRADQGAGASGAGGRRPARPRPPRWDGSRSPLRDRPPRPEARQHHVPQRRLGEACRLRCGIGRGLPQHHAHRPGGGITLLHGPRTGPRGAQHLCR